MLFNNGKIDTKILMGIKDVYQLFSENLVSKIHLTFFATNYHKQGKFSTIL